MTADPDRDNVPSESTPTRARMPALERRPHLSAASDLPPVRILIDYRPALRRRTGVGLWVAKLVGALSGLSPDTAPEIVAFSSSWKDRFTAPLPAGVVRADRRVPVGLLNWLWHRRLRTAEQK
jgi:hypothetical protein